MLKKSLASLRIRACGSGSGGRGGRHRGPVSVLGIRG